LIIWFTTSCCHSFSYLLWWPLQPCLSFMGLCCDRAWNAEGLKEKIAYTQFSFISYGIYSWKLPFFKALLLLFVSLLLSVTVVLIVTWSCFIRSSSSLCWKLCLSSIWTCSLHWHLQFPVCFIAFHSTTVSLALLYGLFVFLFSS
jgi:hypothetical protein